MTPKEKVKELVGKMDIIYKFKLNNGKVLPVSMHTSQQIGCAIVAVEEIIKVMPSVNGRPPNYQDVDEYCSEYWHQVLTELKAMQ